jgi:bifunctional DNA-binding transcriptional regulator/antitoxin component of YhaV-PrlF toxin-antitoxin module
MNKTYTVRMRERGQLTIPQPIREQMSGEMFTLMQIGEALILTPKQFHVDELGEKIAAEMEQTGVPLADLLAGLAEERQAIWQEKQDA